MNLLFRMLMTLFKAFRAKQLSVGVSSVLEFRVLPFDLDINFHLTNSRYLSFMDLGRLYYTGQVGLIGLMFKKRWQPVVADCEITFIRQVRLFSKIIMTTELVSWDEKYQYFYQRFMVNGHTVATALVKTALYSKGRAVPCADIIGAVDPDLVAPAMPHSVTLLRELSRQKRDLHG